MTLLMIKQKIASRKKRSLRMARRQDVLSQPSRQDVRRFWNLSRRRLKKGAALLFNFPTASPEENLRKRASDSSKMLGFLARARLAVLEKKNGISALLLSFFRHRRHWAVLGGLAVMAVSLTLLAVVASPGSLQIAFPDDPILFSHLLDYASVREEFNGQGSGDILPVTAPYLPAVSLMTHTIQRGDTLSAIAGNYGLTVRTLIGYNSITDVYALMPGTKLQIPDADGIPYRVQRGDSLDSIAGSYNIGINDLLDANNLASTEIQPGDSLFIPGGKISSYAYKKALKTLFIYPARGRITSGFGYRSDPFTGERRFHYALDLANRTGTPILASQGGVVISVLDRTTGYGKSLVLRHLNGYQTLYAHLNEFLVQKGERVSQGQMIGKMGNTGRSSGPHLHFSVYKDNIPVNPLSYLYQ